ncbi:alpha-L-fucosidase [Arcticibacter sp. MXS-1]|uniref:alpha-L-fucosidase n=1 Tax=Arcticibacter sp. MXS-1 TaxID=3341726 RepID=UPI0035A8AB6F
MDHRLLKIRRTPAVFVLAVYFLLFGQRGQSQVIDKKSFVKIDASDTQADIIRKAVKVVPSARQLRWQKLELTAFLHFGINTFTGREWGDGGEDPGLFNPSDLDARQWIGACKAAGFKQVILTAKHHDGFCLWPSAYTDHSVKSSPWKLGKGDVVKEVAEACREFGVGFGVYLSPWDRNNKSFGTPGYNDYFINQLTELLSNYGKVDEVWFDGANGEGPEGKKQVYDFNRWYALIRKLQPSAVIAVMGPDVRWVGTESGYGRETEWSVVPGDALVQENVAANSQKEAGFAPMNMMEEDLGSREKLLKAKSLVWYPAEIDVSIRPGWFYHEKEDSEVKNADKLLDIYFSSVGRNGVLLLNIPPDKRGLLSDSDLRALEGFRRKIDEVFRDNVLQDAVVEGASSAVIRKLTDGNDETAWTAKDGNTTPQLVFSLKTEKEFNLLVLQENIRKGQRIERFRLDVFQGGKWKKVTDGTTVGYKRILRFSPVGAEKLRLVIESSRANPIVSEVGLFYSR